MDTDTPPNNISVSDETYSPFGNPIEDISPICFSAATSPAPLGSLAAPMGGLSQLAGAPWGTAAKGVPVGITDVKPNNPPHQTRKTPKNRIKPPHQKYTPGYMASANSGRCGEVLHQVLCPEDPAHFHELHSYTCHRPACPECWTSWASRAASDAADRIEAYGRLNRGRTPRHISFSPRPGEYGPDDLARMLEDLNRVLRRFGCEAAACIPHPYRLAGDAPDDEPDKSRTNRYRAALDSPDWRDLVSWAPHVHCMIYGPLPSSDVFEDKTGWVYRNHEKDTKAARGRSGDELKGTLYYLLTHAWVLGNNAVVRYWFGMSTRKLGRVEDAPQYEDVICPVCKACCVKAPPDIRQFDGTYAGFYQDLHNAPKATVMRRRFRFFMRVKP